MPAKEFAPCVGVGVGVGADPPDAAEATGVGPSTVLCRSTPQAADNAAEVASAIIRERLFFTFISYRIDGPVGTQLTPLWTDYESVGESTLPAKARQENLNNLNDAGGTRGSNAEPSPNAAMRGCWSSVCWAVLARRWGTDEASAPRAAEPRLHDTARRFRRSAAQTVTADYQAPPGLFDERRNS
jgi:hypothetical protein